MRMALLTSMLAYACGLCLLGVDVGRPWNFYWVVLPWHWNMHSPMAEIAICMSIYASIPLFLENIPPMLERLWHVNVNWQPVIERVEQRPAQIFPHHRGSRLLAPRDAPVVPGRLDAAGRTASSSLVADAVSAFAVCGRGHFHVFRAASPEPPCCAASSGSAQWTWTFWTKPPASPPGQFSAGSPSATSTSCSADRYLPPFTSRATPASSGRRHS